MSFAFAKFQGHLTDSLSQKKYAEKKDLTNEIRLNALEDLILQKKIDSAEFNPSKFPNLEGSYHQLINNINDACDAHFNAIAVQLESDLQKIDELKKSYSSSKSAEDFLAIKKLVQSIEKTMTKLERLDHYRTKSTVEQCNALLKKYEFFRSTEFLASEARSKREAESEAYLQQIKEQSQRDEKIKERKAEKVNEQKIAAVLIACDQIDRNVDSSSNVATKKRAADIKQLTNDIRSAAKRGDLSAVSVGIRFLQEDVNKRKLFSFKKEVIEPVKMLAERYKEIDKKPVMGGQQSEVQSRPRTPSPGRRD